MIKRLSFNFLLSIFLAFNASHAEAKNIPYLSSPVIDELNLLSKSEQRELIEFVKDQRTFLQMQVWITRLEGESIEGLSIKAASEWKLGDKDKDNGLLLLIAPQERRMRFEVGRGLEGDIPDILAARILDHVARPQFKKANYYEGIRHALEQAVTLRKGDADAAKLKERYSGDKQQFDFFFVLVFLIILALQIFARFSTQRHLKRRGVDWFGSGGFGGGGGWGSGGGGWSGGGGSFGGGGSSSSW